MALGNGAMSQDKLLRIAAVIYGLDLSAFQSDPANGTSADDASRNMSRQEVLDSRVMESEVLVNRQTAVTDGAELTQIMFQKLQSEKERFEAMRQRFDEYLAQLEDETRQKAIEETQATLEVLAAKHTKTLLLRMLRDDGLDPQDNVVEDVVTIVKGMPQDKLKKLHAEFKSDPEREQLHRILSRIGEFAKK